jgi:hypothetical protein
MRNQELLIAILICLLFYIIIKNNNELIVSPSNEQMKNVIYNTDDINDIDTSFIGSNNN